MDWSFQTELSNIWCPTKTHKGLNEQTNQTTKLKTVVGNKDM